MSKEEIELRDLVAQTLENNGVLSRIRAELRASVFLALQEEVSVMDSPQFTNKPLKAFLSTAEGSLVACLVREFLEFFQLNSTLSVFDPETAQGKYYNYGGRSKLIKDLRIENSNGKKGPLLVQILHTTLSQNADSSSVKKEGNKPSNGKNTSMPSTISSALLDSNTPLNKVSRVEEEMSPRSTSVSEVERTSQSSIEANKCKTESSETTPRNSPTPEQPLTHRKPETQAASNSKSIRKCNIKSESKKKKPQQTNKQNVEPATSTLSSLSNLPPLMGVNFPIEQPVGFLHGISQPKNMHQIKPLIDFGLESKDDCSEYFHSSASISGKECKKLYK